MRNRKNFFTVIGFISAALLLIALTGNVSGKMNANNQNSNQSASTTAKPDNGHTRGHSVPDTSLMRPMARPLDNFRPDEPLENNDTLPEIKKDYFMRKYLKLKADTDSPLVGNTGPMVKDDVVSPLARRQPSGHMPADPHIFDPAFGRQEPLTAGPDLGGGETSEESYGFHDWERGVFTRKTHLDNGHTVIYTDHYDAGSREYRVYNERGELIHHSYHFDENGPGQPAGGCERPGSRGGFIENELKKKFGGKSPIAIDMATGFRKGRTWTPISTEDMANPDQMIDPGTGEARPKPRPNESVGPGATASDDDGEGIGSGLGPTGDKPGIGGPRDDGKGLGSKSTMGKGIPRGPSTRDLVIQPDAPGDSEGSGDNFLESHEGESPFRKLSIIDGDPRVGQ